jgi:hypothetical protein
MKKDIKIQLILFCLLFTSSVYAQVNIGSQAIPEAAALLQFKTDNILYDLTGDETADKGILLPRVKLNGLKDMTAVLNNPDPDKIADLTGLLVYNVSDTNGMAKGIYEWDGNEWGLLEIRSEKDGSYTKKSIVSVVENNSLDEDKTMVSVGRFSFRFSLTKEVQCKMNVAPSGTENIGYHIARFWDGNGYAYNSKNLTFSSTDYGWKGLHSQPMSEEQHWEVWLADSQENKVYNVQFIIYTNEIFQTTAYVVLVTEY